MARGNPANFRPARTSEEARELGKKGGKKSAEKKRRDKTMREAAKILMCLPVKFASMKKIMTELGIEDQEMTNVMAIVVSMYKEALNGNVRAAMFIQGLLGDEGAERAQAAQIELEKKKMELEIARLEQQISAGNGEGDGMPVIINVRPE
jgi:hypothetical protein